MYMGRFAMMNKLGKNGACCENTCRIKWEGVTHSNLVNVVS
jgi:hypothetical protein